MSGPARHAFVSRGTLGVVLLYACWAALWILLSDQLLAWLVTDPGWAALVNTVKGWAFVAVTSLLLFWLLRRADRDGAAPTGRAAPAPRRLAVLLPLGVAFAGMVGLYGWHQYDELKSQARVRLQFVAESKAREIGEWHNERLRDAAWAQRSQYLREHWLRWRQSGRPADALRLRQFMMRYFVNDAIFKRVEIIDTDGHMALDNTVQAALPASPLGSPNVHPTLHQAVLEALTSNQPQRAGPWRDTDGTLRLAFVTPLAADSPWPGAMAMHLDPSDALHPALEMKTGVLPVKTADLFVYRQDGDELVMLSELRYARDAALRQRLPLDDERYMAVQALRGGAAAGQLLEGWDYRRVASYGMAQRIAGTDWWLLAKQDRAELLQGALMRSVWMALAGALALLAAGTALYLHDARLRARHAARELEELRHIERSLSESEAQFRLLAENTSDVLWLYDLVGDRYLYLSPSVQQQLGYRPEELLSFSVSDMLAAPEVEPMRAELARRLRLFAAGNEALRTITTETSHRHKDGHMVPLEVVSTLITDEQGQVTRLLGVARDITQRRRAQSELIRLSQAIEQSPASVIITGLDGRIEYVNHAFEQLSGYPREEVIGQKPALLRSGHTPPETYAALWAALRAGQTWTGELVNRHRSGREYVQTMNMAPVRDAQGQITHYLAVQMDVTAQRNAEQMASRLAWFDPLTGRPNRHRLLVELEEALQAHARSHEVCVLLLLNLDRFQTVNDALGHAAGDLLLKRVGDRLAGLLQSGDQLAHLNADEFAMLLHTGSADAESAAAAGMRRAQELHACMDSAFRLEAEATVNIGCCIGLTVLPQADGDTPGAVLRRADTALHRAKDAGTRQTACFDASMEQLISRRFSIEQDLRRGLGAQELRLYLQPQVNAQGHMVSAEALVRWQHPELGLLAPAHFIPITEESELIIELGRWVLNAVCQHLGELRRGGLRLPIAVNISPRQFHQPGFVHVVQDHLQLHGAAPDDLVIEITESIVVDQMDSVVRKMSHLNSVGVRFSLDDFGTGYSSLAYLKRLPIHEIKIDRSFVQDAPNDPNDAALVDAILAVARHLRLKVVAEGVETQEQAEFLRVRGPLIQQGYLYGRPEPAESLLTRWRASQQGSPT